MCYPFLVQHSTFHTRYSSDKSLASASWPNLQTPAWLTFGSYS
jgi:hypothetical protein